MIKYFNSIYVISIHTPARGVTHSVHSIRLPKIYFNPHSRKGSDWQSQRMNQLRPYFNPHSRKGSDADSDYLLTTLKISIHTPARGVTYIIIFYTLSVLISIHTPARGVTPLQLSIESDNFISIHTPARGVTLCNLISFLL